MKSKILFPSVRFIIEPIYTNLYIDFRIEFQYEGFIFIALCNRLHKSFDFLESVTKLVLYRVWKRFPMQKLTGGD